MEYSKLAVSIVYLPEEGGRGRYFVKLFHKYVHKLLLFFLPGHVFTFFRHNTIGILESEHPLKVHKLEKYNVMKIQCMYYHINVLVLYILINIHIFYITRR